MGIDGGSQPQEGAISMKTRISVQERLKDLRWKQGLNLVKNWRRKTGISKISPRQL